MAVEGRHAEALVLLQRGGDARWHGAQRAVGDLGRVLLERRVRQLGQKELGRKVKVGQLVDVLALELLLEQEADLVGLVELLLLNLELPTAWHALDARQQRGRRVVAAKPASRAGGSV